MKPEEYRKIIFDAISKEVESYVFYRSVTEKVADKALKSTFKELAGEEVKHREFLEGLLAKPLKELHFDESRDYKVSKTIERPTVNIDMKPLDGIKLAIKKEEDSMNLYKGLSAASQDAGMKKMFDSLMKMETSHKARLEDIYTNQAFPEVW
ncbi:MAG TPA: ferritin family protein [Methanomicrobiales archaeon]|jgi:rubrerythrin|nr:ferritin family protein [Methanomicrobiales archaeon]